VKLATPVGSRPGRTKARLGRGLTFGKEFVPLLSGSRGWTPYCIALCDVALSFCFLGGARVIHSSH
jgi:hypothetical protein